MRRKAKAFAPLFHFRVRMSARLPSTFLSEIRRDDALPVVPLQARR
jgi:hypothetical protein